MAVMLGAAVAFPPPDVLRALALTVFTTTALSGLHYVQAFTRRAWTTVADRERVYLPPEEHACASFPSECVCRTERSSPVPCRPQP